MKDESKKAPEDKKEERPEEVNDKFFGRFSRSQSSVS